MPIRVTCRGCHARFTVSEKFAGKSGPCPKCKKTIKIPTAAEEVKVHEPEAYGPTGVSGQAVLKPIFREETALSGVQIALIVCGVIGFLLIALVLRVMIEDPSAVPSLVLGTFALLLAVPAVFAAYTFLRDSELAPYRGRELWLRVGICSLVYTLLWLSMPVSNYAFGNEWFGTEYTLGSFGTAIVVMLAIGGATAHLVFGLDYLMGLMHYGFYLGICLLGRWLAGFGLVPSIAREPEDVALSGGVPPVGETMGLPVLAETLCQLAPWLDPLAVGIGLIWS